MKRVHVRRHAPKHAAGDLTDEGKVLASRLRAELVAFDIVISSPKPRAMETARLLTGVDPIPDTRAGTPAFTNDQEMALHHSGEDHPFGIAGVLLNDPSLRSMIIPQGEKLVQLIHETFDKLPGDGEALIISHDGVMVTAERILRNLSLTTTDKTYAPLLGYIVYEDGSIEILEKINPDTE